MTTHVIQPMLCTEVHSISEIKLPCFVSEKLNGIRAIWNPTERKFQTRNGKFWHDWMTSKIFKSGTSASMLDGEFYVPGLPLGQLTSRAGVKVGNDTGLPLEYHVYDYVSSGTTTDVRVARLYSGLFESENIKVVHHEYCINIADIGRYTGQLQHMRGADNVEGIVCRTAGYTYASGCRSPYMQKLKFMRHLDVTVLQLHEGLGKFTGTLGAMTVRTEDGTTFRCGGGSMKNPDRAAVWADKSKYIGAVATIEFPYYSEFKVPLQAQFITWRDYE